MYPAAVLTGYYTLRTEYNAVSSFVAESVEDRGYLVLSVGIRSFSAPAREYVICMVVVMFVIVVMIVTAAGAVRTVIVVVFMLVVIVMMMFVFIMIMVVMLVVVIMVVAAAGAVRTVVVVMFMLVVVMVMVFVFIMIMMVVMMLCFLKKLLELIIEGVLLSHSVNELLSCELIPLGSNDRCSRIELLETLYTFVYLIL